VRISEIFDKETLDRKLRTLAHSFEKRYGGLLQGYDVDEEIKRMDHYRAELSDFVVDAVPLIESAQSSPDTKLLVEGANALMLDVDYGTYPYVTSSNTGIGGVFTGLALNPFKLKEVIGVVKAYTTRVGGGPLPTEQINGHGEMLQSVGKEFGVTTGRKRVSWSISLVVHAVRRLHALSVRRTIVIYPDNVTKVAG
jgi:adenylosuccinate synthase